MGQVIVCPVTSVLERLWSEVQQGRGSPGDVWGGEEEGGFSLAVGGRMCGGGLVSCNTSTSMASLLHVHVHMCVHLYKLKLIQVLRTTTILISALH